MKHQRALLLNKIAWASLTPLIMLSCMLSIARGAHAQIPFDDLDWLMDRGQNLRFGPAATPNGLPYRQGAPNINNTGMSPGHAVQRFVWPRSEDLPATAEPTVIVDNLNLADPQNFTDTSGNHVRVSPSPPAQTGNNPSLMAQAFLGGAWNLPEIVPGAVGDYRSPLGGFSLSSDLTQVYTDDYAYIGATSYTFNAQIADSDLAAMPYPVGTAQFPANQVYQAVETAVLSAPAAATYSSGGYNMTAGSYGVDIYSPGSGTVINGVVHPSAFRMFVRVSYGGPGVNTQNLVGTMNAAGVDDPRYSRIYEVDEGTGGWIHIAAGGLGPAVFPYSGNALQPLVVTIYTITPDSLTDPEYLTPPVITADAVRFIPVSPPAPAATTFSPLINPNNRSMAIGPSGRILGPVVGTNKITQDRNGVAIANTPLVYVGREESYLNTTPNYPFNPTLPVSGTNPLVIDPTQLVTEPVFYCLESEPENLTPTAALPTSNPSWERVIWRFVGEPDVLTPSGSGDNSGTSAASPFLANVRCRDGQIRSMVYFLTTNGDGTLGHIYALDPAGDSVKQTTTPYWVYPSFRPLLAADAANPNLPFQIHDPNYYNHATNGVYVDGGVYKTTTQWWALDSPLAPNAYGEFYDGDLIPNPANANNLIVQQDTLVPMAGVLGPPVIVDDASPTAAMNPPQLLVVPTLDGHVFALDAGGRGDYTDQMGNTLTYTDPNTLIVYDPGGTTQRMWSWPHYPGDAYHLAGLTGPNPNTQGATSTAGLAEPIVGSFPGGICYDPTYASAGGAPFMLGGDDGHFYALSPGHDTTVSIGGNGVARWNERRDWVYPAPDNAGLNGGTSTAAIFQPTNSNTKFIYFTVSDSVDGGRVYSLPETPINTQDSVFTNGLNWVFPSTPNPPFPNPNNSLSEGIFPGFSGQAPVLMSAATINTAVPNTSAVPTDICYVVGDDGTIYGLDAGGGSNGTGVGTGDGVDPLYSGQTLTGSPTEASPVGSMLIGLPGVSFTDITNIQPALIYADDNGNIWGLGARPFNDPTFGAQPGPYGNSSLLAPIWGFSDAVTARVAAASVVGGDLLDNPAPGNALIYEGDEGGQLRAYGFGFGAGGLGSYTAGLEPQGAGFGASYDSIDVRVVDIYQQTDWNRFYKGLAGTLGAYETPLQYTNGPNATQGAQLANYAAPLNLGLGNGPNGGKLIVQDWGDTLYVAVAGVYHALPTTNTALPEYGDGAPQITVYITFSQPGGSTTAQVPLIAGNLVAGWPDDPGVTAAEHNQLSIYGIDPSNMGLTPQELTGPAQNVYPWVATHAFPLTPQAGAMALQPGLKGFKITARAVITQSVTSPAANLTAQPETIQSNVYELGQHDPIGLNSVVNGTPEQIPGYISTGGGANGVGPAPSLPYTFGIANPLAVTVRSYNGANQDQTGIGQSNIIGWYGAISSMNNPPADIRELLGNQNTLPSLTNTVQVTSPAKALFAPFPMVPDGSVSNYMGDNAGTPVTAFYIADRSNLVAATQSPLRVKISPNAAAWHGFAPSAFAGSQSAVMNPLPWEILPNDSQSTRDYPSIGTNNFSITVNGTNATGSGALLSVPNGNGATRIMVPTPVLIGIKVPKYQPANVNYGVRSFGGFTFGSGFTDLSGQLVGAQTAGSPLITGPNEITTGLSASLNSGYAYPAGGYLSELTIQGFAAGSSAGASTQPGPTLTGGSGFDPGSQFGSRRAGGAAAATPASSAAGASGTAGGAIRLVDIGIAVPPRIALSTVETTIDLGNEPHGTGYSPPSGGNPAIPFSPNYLADYPTGNSPYDNANLYGNFFQGFTVVNDSNVNIVDLRAAKMSGLVNQIPTINAIAPGANPGTGLASIKAYSDEVSNLNNTPLIGMPFPAPGLGLGNFAFVTSLDHISTNSGNFPERALWGGGLPVNPYVVAADLAAAIGMGAILPTTDNPAKGYLGWKANFQPQPTIGKSRVGDGSGRFMTVPDKPYNAPATPVGNVQFLKPEIGVTVPLGTPVGTYSTPVYLFEDNTPVQWREWLSHLTGIAGVTTGADHDSILNTTQGSNGAPVEPFTSPTFTVKVTVRESRLSRGTTAGNLSMLDYMNPVNSLLNDWVDTAHGIFAPPGSDTTPAAWIAPGSNGAANASLQLYWPTNRRPSPADMYINGASGLVSASAPWDLAYSTMPTPYSALVGYNYGDANFQRTATPAWWSKPNLFMGSTTGGQSLANLFPATAAEAAAVGIPGLPFLAGARNPSTEHHGSPAITSSGAEAYLFWVSDISKTQAVGGVGLGPSVIDSRINWMQIGAGGPTGAVYPMANDPSVPKGSPKPLLLNLAAANGAPAQKFMYVFWHQGNQSRTSIYYNYAASGGGAFSGNGTPFQTVDQQLQVPNALNWETDPTPVYRKVTFGGALIDVIDVVYTGVLKNRQNVETLLSRYQIVRTSANPGLIGTLTPMPLPPVTLELAARQGNSGTFITRDAAWILGSGPEGTILPTDTVGNIAIYDVPVNGLQTLLNPSASNPAQPSLGRYDQASGLIFYDSAVIGGQIVVDPRSGTINFPQVGPQQGSSLLVNYSPQVMRLNVSRDDPNLNREFAIPGAVPSSYAGPHPARPPVGNNTQPLAFLDTTANPRSIYTSPQVVFGGAMPTDRFWLFYKKVDPSNAARSSVYYHAMRLMVTLPFPVQLNGNNQISNLTVAGNAGPYEVDWTRGRIFFTEQDEARPITVTYTGINGANPVNLVLNFVVAWGDEQVTANSNQTTSEALVPMGTVTNEGQMNAFKDPFIDKVWLFWSSTRANSTDMYFETMSPQFYATASNQN